MAGGWLPHFRKSFYSFPEGAFLIGNDSELSVTIASIRNGVQRESDHLKFRYPNFILPLRTIIRNGTQANAFMLAEGRTSIPLLDNHSDCKFKWFLNYFSLQYGLMVVEREDKLEFLGANWFGLLNFELQNSNMHAKIGMYIKLVLTCLLIIQQNQLVLLATSNHQFIIKV